MLFQQPNIHINSKYLFILFLISISLLTINRFLTKKYKHLLYPMMTEANRSVLKVHKEMRNLYQSRKIVLNSERDPLKSGFIGVEFSPLTTTLGNLRSKQISTSPEFAALLIRWFDQLDLSKGDQVVIHASGSFPALAITSVIACKVYGLQPHIISSVGASSYGANRPDLTYWDIEKYLYEKGLINSRTEYATLGGKDDKGSSFWPGGLEIAKQAAIRNGIYLNIPGTLPEAIRQKVDYIEGLGEINLLINIGGNQAAMGRPPGSLRIPAGLIKKSLTCNNAYQGLIHYFIRSGIPVIHFLHIQEIAFQHGITESKNYSNTSESEIYYNVNYSKPFSVIAVIILLILQPLFRKIYT